MLDKTQLQNYIESEASDADKIAVLEQQFELDNRCFRNLNFHSVLQYCGLNFIQWVVQRVPSPNFKTSLLFKSCYHDNLEATQWLIAHGADIHAIDSRGCSIFHHLARGCKDIQIFEELLKHDQAMDVNQKNKYRGSTPLMDACDNGKTEAVQWLIAHHADIHATDFNGRTALHYAAEYGNVEIIAQLQQHGADLNVKYRSGLGLGRFSALYLAINFGRFDAVLWLLQHGATSADIDNSMLITHIRDDIAIEVYNYWIVDCLKQDKLIRLESFFESVCKRETHLQYLDKILTRLLVTPKASLAVGCQIDVVQINILLSCIHRLWFSDSNGLKHRIAYMFLENHKQGVLFDEHESLLFAAVFFNAVNDVPFLEMALSLLVKYPDKVPTIADMVQDKAAELMEVIHQIKQIYIRFENPSAIEELFRLDKIFHSAFKHYNESILLENRQLRERCAALHAENESLLEAAKDAGRGQGLKRSGFFQVPDDTSVKRSKIAEDEDTAECVSFDNYGERSKRKH